MTPLAWLIGFLLPACGAQGVAGLPPPQPLDLRRIERPASPNTALAAPAGSMPAPDVVTPIYPFPPARLQAALRDVAAAQPRTFLAGDDLATWQNPGRQAHWVVRSAVWNFPDLVTSQIGEADPHSSTLMLYSRSVYGYSDLGANRRRLDTWLAALRTSINQPGER